MKNQKCNCIFVSFINDTKDIYSLILEIFPELVGSYSTHRLRTIFKILIPLVILLAIVSITVSEKTSINAESTLNIFTTQDLEDRIPYNFEIIKFYANWTNSTDDSSIQPPASCNLTIRNNNDVNNTPMVFGPDNNYTYNYSFNVIGDFEYNVSCSGSGYSQIIANDSINITQNAFLAFYDDEEGRPSPLFNYH